MVGGLDVQSELFGHASAATSAALGSGGNRFSPLEIAHNGVTGCFVCVHPSETKILHNVEFAPSSRRASNLTSQRTLPSQQGTKFFVVERRSSIYMWQTFLPCALATLSTFQRPLAAPCRGGTSKPWCMYAALAPADESSYFIPI